MEIESVECECCGLREDCTQEYISTVKANFYGKWLCGLCTEVVREEVRRGRKSSKGCGVDEALGAHMSFCRNFRSNPAICVTDGMRQMLRRRSGDMSATSACVSMPSKKFGRSSFILKSVVLMHKPVDRLTNDAVVWNFIECCLNAKFSEL